jgi:acyl-CoA synthetase (AMP-forming)/AMP-acid ligase II
MPSQDQTTRVARGPAPDQSLAFRNKLQSRLDHGSHAEGSAVGGLWFRTGDLAVYLDGELYITGRINSGKLARRACRAEYLAGKL